MLRKLVTYSEREEIKMKKLRVGIVGCGGIANQKHFPALKSQSELCEMVAFCDIIEERAKKACEEYGAERGNQNEEVKSRNRRLRRAQGITPIIPSF